MTQKEIDKFLADTKVYVNGKSREIQEKLFSLGYSWGKIEKHVRYTDKPFLYIWADKSIGYSDNMEYFIKHQNKEITAEQILALELTEPSYRPFKAKEECWNEMQKHQPFGWTKSKRTNNLYNMSQIYEGEGAVKIMMDDVIVSSYELFKDFEFADGTPFGIKEE